MIINGFTLTLIIYLLFGFCQAEAKDNKSALDAWESTRHGVTFSIAQLPAEAVGAFYIGRGFTLEQIQLYMSTCVYTSVLRNDDAPGRIHYDLGSWSILNEGETKAVVRASVWIEQFRQNGIPEAALMAFRLAQLPDEQKYEPRGDWNQGMLSVNLPRGSHFDIIVRWDIQGEPYELLLQNISCT